jgi:hypothetical protein
MVQVAGVDGTPAIEMFLTDSLNSKAVGRYAANGFALSPIRAVFSDSIRRVSRPVVK